MNHGLAFSIAGALLLASAGARAANTLSAENEYLNSIDCEHRIYLAKQIARDLAQGYPLDNLNIVAPTSPDDPEAAARQQAWATELKAEIAEAAKPLDPQDDNFADRLAANVAESCHSKRNMQEARLHRTASSQALAYPETPIRHKCGQQRHAAMVVVELARSGVRREDFWVVHPLPDHWSDAIKSEAMALVDAAYAWNGAPAEFCDRIYRDCMQAR